MATYKSSDWKEVKFNGQDVTKIILNGTTVWEKENLIPPILSITWDETDVYVDIQNDNNKQLEVHCSWDTDIFNSPTTSVDVVPSNFGIVRVFGVYGSWSEIDITITSYFINTATGNRSDTTSKTITYSNVDTSTTTTYALLKAVATEGNFTLYRGENNE